MKRVMVAGVLAWLVGLSPAVGEISPFGTYTLTFERTGWSESRTISVQPFPTAEPFYTVGGDDVNVYLQPLGERPGGITEMTWYVNAPAVMGDPANLELLGGSGPLTITVADLTFATPDNVAFEPLVTHIYYVGYTDGAFVPLWIPAAVPVSPGDTQVQHTPVRPLTPADPDYATYGEAYGQPYQSGASGSTVSFVLPEMYVPDGGNAPIWELSFGAGFTNQVIPAPTAMILAVQGFVCLWAIRRRRG